jgi:alpha-L-fucosidase
LKVGFYHSLPDWTHPGYADKESPEYIQRKELHVPTPEQYAAFKELVYNHIHQLMTEYGKIDLLFLDYTSKYKADEDYFDRERILKMVYECQPDILVNDRLTYWKDNCRDFDYYAPEICVPNQPQVVKGKRVLWESCATMNDNWGFARDDHNWKSVDAIIAGLVGCVAQDGNLLLNVGPNELGEIPMPSVERLKAVGEWFKVNGESITGCGWSPYKPPYGCAYTQKGNVIYCHFLQTPLGDTILPQLKGKVKKITLLRTGVEVEQDNVWGFELLKADEQRIHTRALKVGDVLKMELK